MRGIVRFALRVIGAVGFIWSRRCDAIDIGGRTLVASRQFRNFWADPCASAVDGLALDRTLGLRASGAEARVELAGEHPLYADFGVALIRVHPLRALRASLVAAELDQGVVAVSVSRAAPSRVVHPAARLPRLAEAMCRHAEDLLGVAS